jgi:hypothetical protein
MTTEATAGRAEPLLPLAVAVSGNRELVVRAVGNDDVDQLIALYAGLSDVDRHRRFFTQFRASRSWVVDWVRRCRENGAGIVAELSDTGELIGEAAYVLQSNGNGEFSLTVDSQWRGWLGPYLLDVLADVAAERGVQNLEAEILTENRAMQAITRHRNAVRTASSDHSVTHVVIGTRGRQATWSPVGARRRILVEIPGGRWAHGRDIEGAGYEVLACPGPDRRRDPCPALTGEPCPLAATADAIVVAVPPGSADALTAAHLRLHPDVPMVIIDADDPVAKDADSSSDDVAPPVGCRLARDSTSTTLLEVLDRLTS